ncbi:MAG: hypothetical protein ACHQFW_05250 [Chitinophagales bacterium]
MEKLFTIEIITDDRSGLAEIIAGYLNFYSNKKTDVSIHGIRKVIHPLAQQVLREDRIEIYSPAALKQNDSADLFIIVNNAVSGNLPKISEILNFQFNDPLLETSYNETLNAYRAVRDEIKKKCIELIGELQSRNLLAEPTNV